MNEHDVTRISLPVYLDRHNSRYPIYIILTVGVIAAILALPFLSVDVTVGSPGILRPVVPATPIKAYSSGVVTGMFARENQRVVKGDALISVHVVEVADRERRAGERLKEISILLGDLRELTKRVTPDSRIWMSWVPATPLYQQALADFMQRYRDEVARSEQSKRDHLRSKQLFHSGVIAASEMEQADETLRKSTEAVERIVNSQLTEWQQQILKYEVEMSELKTSMLEAKHADELNQILAPVSGTVLKLVGLYPGSRIFSGQEIGYISPDTTLVAEIQVPPENIGGIHEGLPVRLQISTYNYNDWGVVDAMVTDVSDDVIMDAHNMHYVVICSLSQKHLSHRSGLRVPLRKGMTLHARFIVGRSTMWQLLYNRADEWVNPAG